MLLPPPRVFARAWSNLDDVPGYQADGEDVLIAEVVDGNGSGTLDAGDTVTANMYPADLDASSFGQFGVTSHVVTSVARHDPAFVDVLTVTGRHSWFIENNVESYS